jgi:similar to stage IV sporulation protein
VGIRKVHAQGQVYARTSHTLRVEMPYQTVECRRTGKIRRKFTLKIFNFSINLYFGGGIPYAIYDKIDTVNDARIGSFILPLSLITHTYYQKESVSVSVSPDDAAAAAGQMLELREQQDFFGCEYVCTNKSVTHGDGCAVALGEYVCVRDIAQAVPIE